MASKIIILLLALAAVTAVPITLDIQNQTTLEVLIRKGLVGFVPVVLPLDKNFNINQDAARSTHILQKRSFGEELTNDLLEDFEGVKEDHKFNLDRRIKTLPSWVG